MNLSTGVKNFIEKNIELLEREDYQEFDDRAGMQTSENGYSKSELYEVLLKAGINPLPYLPYVPYAFLRNTDITGSFTIPGNCEEIGSRSFYECSLSEIVIEEGVRSISSLAFARSRNLKKVYFPKSLMHLDNILFMGCSALEEIIYPGTYEEFKNIHSNSNNAKHPWFGPTTTLAATNCILKCKDQDISLRVDL